MTYAEWISRQAEIGLALLGIVAFFVIVAFVVWLIAGMRYERSSWDEIEARKGPNQPPSNNKPNI